MLTAYRILMTLALPWLLAGVALRHLRGQAVQREARERLALSPSAPQPLLWLHGASNGEITSARWLIEDLLHRDAALHIVVTCNNPTARDMVQGWALARCTAVLAPWDTVGATRRFLRRHQPRGLVLLENELWPERLIACAAAGIPVISVGARFSAGSARNWSRVAPGLLRRMLGGLALVSAQDEASEARLVAAGLPALAIGPRVVLKSRPAAAPAAEPPFATPPRPRCLLAASTHEGEETPVLDAFLQVRATFDLLILAPRHPQRGPAIAALAEARGLTLKARSRQEAPDAGTDVYLADTLGEMPLWYALCGATFIGGSLVAKGGHTPFEPILQDSAILHGPSTHNFTEIFAALDAQGAALAVTAESLATALRSLTPAAQAQMARAARATLPPPTDTAVLTQAIARLTGIGR